MTDEKTRAIEFARTFRDHAFQFSGYYKYAFDYTSRENPSVSVSLGGDRDEIYRSTLSATMTLRDLVRECGTEHGLASVEGEYFDLDYDEVWEVLNEHDDAAQNRVSDLDLPQLDVILNDLHPDTEIEHVEWNADKGNWQAWIWNPNSGKSVSGIGDSRLEAIRDAVHVARLLPREVWP